MDDQIFKLDFSGCGDGDILNIDLRCGERSLQAPACDGREIAGQKEEDTRGD